MLESRHLVGLFMLLVVIFGVVFTLGYLLGRSQYDGQLRAAVGKINDAAEAATSPAKPSVPSAAKSGSPAAVPSSDLDFYHTADNDKPDDHLQPKTQTAAAYSPAPLAEPPKPSAPKSVERITAVASKGPSLNAPLIPKGAIMLQVAALQREGDALALAQALQQAKFPAFVINPGADKFYRVQVGPYADDKAASKARASLEAKGFKSILKR